MCDATQLLSDESRIRTLVCVSPNPERLATMLSYFTRMLDDDFYFLEIYKKKFFKINLRNF